MMLAFIDFFLSKSFINEDARKKKARSPVFTESRHHGVFFSKIYVEELTFLITIIGIVFKDIKEDSV